MRVRNGGLTFLAGLIAITTSGCDSTPRESTLFGFQIDAETGQPSHRKGLHKDAAIGWFESGWSNPEPERLWALGKESVLRLRVSGEQPRLELTAGTLPVLKQQNPDALVRVFADGREIGTIEALPRWDAGRDYSFAIPSELAADRMVEFRFVSTDCYDPASHMQPGEKKPLSFYLKRLELIAFLDESQRQELTAASQPAAMRASVERTELRIPRSSASSGTTEPPDVLLILLDAARADHISAAGYARETTPTLDRLAEHGVLFQWAFSTSSYTLSGMASLFTGMSWAEHGLVDPGSALSPAVVTLPEIFSLNGYATVGITSNSYWSAATNADQGFDLFENVWKDPRRGKIDVLDLPSICLDEKLARLEGSKPAFAFVHLAPPHAPYEPGPGHDLWAPDVRDSTVDGSVECIRRFNRTDDWSESQRQELMSLYDGHLHRADSDVAMLIEAWSRRRPDRPLSIVVLSDHGEAFGEHGRFGHSSSVNDEMTHILALMYPRSSFRCLEALAPSMLSIADISGLLAHALELRLPDEEDLPPRTRALAADPTLVREEIALRGSAAARGIRTDKWLATSDGWLGRELYDLQADPGCEQNLLSKNPDVYADHHAPSGDAHGQPRGGKAARELGVLARGPGGFESAGLSLIADL